MLIQCRQLARLQQTRWTLPQGTRTVVRILAHLYVYLLGPVFGGYSLVMMTTHSHWVLVLLVNIPVWFVFVIATPSGLVESQAGHGYMHQRAARRDVAKRRMVVGVLLFVGTAFLVSR